MTTSETERRQYLETWATTIETAAARGVFGKKVGFRDAATVNGPRAGAIELDAGVDAPMVLKAMQAGDCALMRQFIPFNFVGDPSVFMSGRRVRLEAGWPGGLAQDNIPLRDLGQHPTDKGYWLVGVTERGNVLTAGLNDSTPHWLISGATGSGKTVTLTSAIGQLSRDTQNRMVLIDAKHGASFRPMANVRGLVGPLADDIYSARSALAWCVQEMTNRYSGGRDDRRLIVFIDEAQDIANDNVAAESLRRLVVQGRGANINVILATQHPVVASLGGPTVGRNLVGRLALRVADADASRVAIGGNRPRADYLLGRGDAYAVAPGATHRVQVAYLDSKAPTGEPEIPEWPEDPGDLPDNSGWPTGEELGAAIVAASRGDGRVKFQRACEDTGVHIGGNDKAVKLLALARDTLDWLNEHNASVRPDIETHSNKRGKKRAGASASTRTDGQNEVEQ